MPGAEVCISIASLAVPPRAIAVAANSVATCLASPRLISPLEGEMSRSDRGGCRAAR
ncbi:hypothetical protein GGD55_004090 [Rhizobium giardinii]|uniref:Uncharacterized protein n=1 Tax=Rhizobium giardinii TaxID=56731 RepID=A0A7W8UDG7_9HYPH|nr:hypothetical protein [Rhizobium giardinii]